MPFVGPVQLNVSSDWIFDGFMRIFSSGTHIVVLAIQMGAAGAPTIGSILVYEQINGAYPRLVAFYSDDSGVTWNTLIGPDIYAQQTQANILGGSYSVVPTAFYATQQGLTLYVAYTAGTGAQGALAYTTYTLGIGWGSSTDFPTYPGFAVGGIAVPGRADAASGIAIDSAGMVTIAAQDITPPLPGHLFNSHILRLVSGSIVAVFSWDATTNGVSPASADGWSTQSGPMVLAGNNSDTFAISQKFVSPHREIHIFNIWDNGIGFVGPQIVLLDSGTFFNGNSVFGPKLGMIQNAQATHIPLFVTIMADLSHSFMLDLDSGFNVPGGVGGAFVGGLYAQGPCFELEFALHNILTGPNQFAIYSERRNAKTGSWDAPINESGQINESHQSELIKVSKADSTRLDFITSVSVGNNNLVQPHAPVTIIYYWNTVPQTCPVAKFIPRHMERYQDAGN